MQLLMILILCWCYISSLYKCVCGDGALMDYVEDVCAQQVQFSSAEERNYVFERCKYESLRTLIRQGNPMELTYRSGLEENGLGIPVDTKTELNDAIYPDMSCHQNYNFDSSSPDTGEGMIIAMLKFCKYEKDPRNSRPGYEECLKICMAEMLGVLDTNSYGYEKILWNSYTDMVNYISLLVTNRASAKLLVNKIFATCGSKIELVRYQPRYPCHRGDWREFFQCLDSVWDCNSM